MSLSEKAKVSISAVVPASRLNLSEALSAFQ
jgi:hypothetical protein